MVLIIGNHVSKVSKVIEGKSGNRSEMSTAIEEECKHFGFNATQIFVSGPRNSLLNKMNYEAIKALSKNLYVSVHSSYPSVAIWKVNPENVETKVSKRIIKHIKDQLEVCKKIGADGLVVHISRKTLEEIKETMIAVEPIIKEVGIPIWLEMICSKSHPELTYETPEKLNALCEELKILDPESWGLCIDTAHVYGSGEDISDFKQQHEWFEKLTDDARNKIKMFHLNGIDSTLGSGKDKHAIAFSSADKLYEKHKDDIKNSGLFSVVNFCKIKSVPMILEINRGTEEETINLMKIISEI